MCYCTWCAAVVLLDVVGGGCGAQRPTTAIKSCFILNKCILSNDALVTSNLVIYGVRDQHTGHHVERNT